MDLFESDGYQRLLLALRVRADKIGAALRQRGHTVSRPQINAEQEAAEKAKRDAAEKARLAAEEWEKQRRAKERADHQKAERAKTLRKPNLAVILGGIGLIGIMLVAILASRWGDWFPAIPEPSATLFFTPTATPYPTQIIDAQGVTMRLVPEGKFTMGSENGTDDEKPVHQVYLDAFYMDVYEVTNALYKACVDAGVCDPPHDPSFITRSSYYGNSEFNDYPVINVDWNQANTYCQWRGARLPTEAEWEKAARGTDGRTYPWGEGIDCARANYLGENCSNMDITEVGQYEKGVSPYGIYDLAGNVWEWVADWYSETFYFNSPFENPVGPNSGQYRVLRGGSANIAEFGMRASHRMAEDPANWEITLGPKGFRCSRSP